MQRSLITVTDSCTLLQLLDVQKALEALEVPKSQIPNQGPWILTLLLPLLGHHLLLLLLEQSHHGFAGLLLCHAWTCQSNGQFLLCLRTCLQQATRGLQLNTRHVRLLNFLRAMRSHNSKVYRLPAFTKQTHRWKNCMVDFTLNFHLVGCHRQS